MKEISYLQTDYQTMSDLRILSTGPGSGSIYDIYNKAATRGGQQLLAELFRKPLGSATAIARRSSIIAHFAGLSSGFIFEAGQLDLVEKYLDTAEESGNRRSHRTNRLDEREMAEAVIATVRIVQQLHQFVSSAAVAGMEPYREEREAIVALLQTPALQPLLSLSPSSRLSFGAVSAYDTLLRVNEPTVIIRLLKYIYYIDVYMSVAMVAREKGYCFATIKDTDGCTLQLTGVFYPQLKHPVVNNLHMSENGNLLFLTGANMAGKSTFLRAIATALYIAHVGFPVAASEMVFSVVDGLYTTINLPDNLGTGASHFYAEVLRVKKMAAGLAAGKRLFVIFDELFRGTNVKDAEEGTVIISAAFSRWKNSLFVVSSHIVEAADSLRKEPTVLFSYLPTNMHGNKPEYTYKLTPGTTADRHGMLIIQNEGVLEILRGNSKGKAAPIT
ncbi:MutS-related protein [Chitinophaga polysaccharea]|uniref:MutS-related protein n=1 Tax=Chitinophaga polysaccharea TaxID=1293035 RepID=UPI001157DCB5|nr:DNA mismatch repair protein [Chitinophaga polysaccharea]